MSRAILDYVTASALRKVPAIKPGATVKIYQKISEGEKERVQMFQGLVIRVSAGAGVDKTFTVRKMVQGVGVEKIFPVHSPTIDKIVIVKQGKVRRSKLYYMRDLQGKSTRLRETDLARAVLDESEPAKEEEMDEEVVEEVKEPAKEEEVDEEVAQVEAELAAAEEAPAEETPAEETSPEAPAEEEQK